MPLIEVCNPKTMNWSQFYKEGKWTWMITGWHLDSNPFTISCSARLCNIALIKRLPDFNPMIHAHNPVILWSYVLSQPLVQAASNHWITGWETFGSGHILVAAQVCTLTKLVQLSSYVSRTVLTASVLLQWLGGPPVSPTPSINGCNDTSGPLATAHTGDRRQQAGQDVATPHPNCDNEFNIVTVQ